MTVTNEYDTQGNACSFKQFFLTALKRKGNDTRVTGSSF